MSAEYTEEEVQADLKKYKAIAALANMEGGKVLIEELRSVVQSNMDMVLYAGADVSHIKLLTHIETLKANLDILRSLQLAEKNKELALEELTRIAERE